MRRDSGAAAALLPPMSSLRSCCDDERELQRERRPAAVAVAALSAALEMGGFAPATASDGRRAPRLNSRFLASAQRRPVAIRVRNKRSICDELEWLATSPALRPRLAPRRVPAKRVTIGGAGYAPWFRARRGCGSWGRQLTPSLSDDAALHAGVFGAIGIKKISKSVASQSRAALSQLRRALEGEAT